jgi:hypothetical protein
MRILFDFKRVVMRGSSSRGKAVRCCQVLQRVNLSSNIIQRSLLTMALREPQEGGAALDAGRILPRSQILLRNGLCVAGRPEDNGDIEAATGGVSVPCLKPVEKITSDAHAIDNLPQKIRATMLETERKSIVEAIY